MHFADYRYVFILTYPRSGSTLLMSLLNHSEGVCLRGENHNALYHLHRSIDTVAQTAHRGRHGQQAHKDEPWFGAPQVKPVQFRDHLLTAFTAKVLAPPEGTRVTGFKEIRHEGFFMNDAQFADYVKFLLDVFPGARIVFNTRAAGAVRNSAWLKERPAAAVETMVATCDRRFETAMAAHPGRCFMVNYESFTADPARYEALFSFLDLPYVPQTVAKVLEKPLLHARSPQKSEDTA